MNENDLRVQRTRSLLRQALIDLVKSQGYESISIRDITKKAQVGYKTFYRHYEGKEALLQALVDEKIGEFQRVLAPPSDPAASHKNTMAGLIYMETNAELFLMILNSSAADQLLNAIIELALEEGRLTFKSNLIPDELMAHHFAASIISLIRWWLETGMEISKETMVEYIDQLLFRPMKNLSLPI